MTLLAIDPGRAVKASIGWCVFAPEQLRSINARHTYTAPVWLEQARGEMTWDDLVVEMLRESWGLLFKNWIINEVVIENFINNPKSRGGQTNGTSEVIGAVEILARQAGVPFTRQPNTILPVAKLHAGYKDRLKHLPHQDAAFLHGHHYLVEKGLVKAVGLG